ncbi:MAG: multiple sugar transport system permease protein [Clostridiales bacterium]|nr:multiple sugar transport system permease protein [Clostridiales bacterium]
MKTRKKHEKLMLNSQRGFAYIVLVIISILCLFSFYILIINTTRSHPDIQKGFSLLPGKSFMNNLKNLLANKQLPVLTGLVNSFFVSTCSALLATYFSAMTAFAIHIYDFKFKKYAFAFILMVMMIPSQVTALGFIKLVRDMNLMNSFIPLTIPSIAAPIVFFFMKQYMSSVLPIDMVEAARIDGAHEFRIFNQIVLPIMKPAMAVQIIFTFVASWNNYFIPALLLNKSNKKTLPILIAQLRSADFLKFDMGQVYMLIALAVLPVVIVYLFLSKSIVRGITLGSVKG